MFLDFSLHVKIFFCIFLLQTFISSHANIVIMYVLSILTFSLLILSVEHNKILPKDCGHQKINLQGRIFGGKKANLGEFPWMARLLHKNKFGEKTFGCSGFLIHSKYVLTAGHCVHKKFIVHRGPV